MEAAVAEDDDLRASDFYEQLHLHLAHHEQARTAILSELYSVAIAGNVSEARGDCYLIAM